MAAALAGGLTMGVMTARSLSGGVRQTANLAKGAGAVPQQQVRGMYGAGKWAANNFVLPTKSLTTLRAVVLVVAPVPVAVAVVGNLRTVMPCWQTSKRR